MECVDGTDLSKYLRRCSPYINHKNEYQVICHGIELPFGGLGGFLRMSVQSWSGSQAPQCVSDPPSHKSQLATELRELQALQ